jgi:chromosome segregation ATPase
MSDDIKALVERRDAIESRKSKLTGKLEVAKNSLQEIDEKLAELGIEPANLEKEIERLRSERDQKIQAFNASLEEAETLLSTIENRIANL